MELVNGRPADETGRLEKEIRVYDLLDSLGISYQRVDHEPAMTIEACQDIDKLMGTHMEELLDITPGSVSVMGLMNDKENKVQLLIDEDLLAHPYLGCHPCINTSSLCIKTEDILKIFLPAVHHKPRYVKLLGE